MRKYFFALVICSTLLCADEIKEEISRYTQLIAEAPKEKKGELLVGLTQAHWADQNQELAFKTYWEALENAQKIQAAISPKEQVLFDEALQLYLNRGNMSHQELASLFRQKYAAILEMHPDYYALSFMMATAYSNLDNIEDFFPLFYKAYSAYPDHFLAHKTKAIIAMKIFERYPVGEQKEFYRSELMQAVHHAISAYPQDSSLYKMLLCFTHKEHKSQNVITCLNKIIDDNIIISRADISFYVQMACEVNEKELASRFIERAHEWYPCSRSLTDVQNYFEDQYGKCDRSKTTG